MKVLALDTATSACSVALWQDDAILTRHFAQMARGQSEALAPMIAQTMAEAGCGFDGLDLLAVSVGPGAFTGIRIGLATARALALATGLPVAGIPTLDAVAAAIPEDERRDRTILVALDSKRAEIWCQTFAADLSPLTAPQALPPEAAALLVDGPMVVAGDAAGLVLDHHPQAVLSTASAFPDAAIVAALAARRWADGTALPPDPLYLRPADVTLPTTTS